MGLAEHAHQALQVEVAVLAAQAEAGHRDGEVPLGDGGDVP